jgi:hypothetical protein
LFLSFLINTHKFTIAQPITCNHRKRRDEHSVTMNRVWWQKGKRFQLPKSYRVRLRRNKRKENSISSIPWLSNGTKL